MKKIIALLFAAIMMVSAIGTCFAARDPATCPHSHCGWKTITAATCTKGGTDWYYCKDCGKNLYYKNTSKLGHSWSCQSGTYLSLTYTYVWHWKCTRCGQTADTYSFSANNRPKPAN